MEHKDIYIIHIIAKGIYIPNVFEQITKMKLSLSYASEGVSHCGIAVLITFQVQSWWRRPRRCC